ncbi:MAG: 1-acyl-sn-glycerol-3-phosphate acyltransferase, partial [Alphaproteobacteria bacterium]|nr:1-acyl-sn-glycerol-3-phosphate acyltransferase [Alphaproteobacteria bacterium]
MIYSSRILAVTRLVLFTVAILLFLPMVMPSLWLAPQKSKTWREKKLLGFHSLCLRIFGISLVVKGEMSPYRPTYFVCNHLSYLDIVVLGGQIPASFISKHEIAAWPIIGGLAKIQRSVFLERTRAATPAHKSELQKRLSDGDN